VSGSVGGKVPGNRSGAASPIRIHYLKRVGVRATKVWNLSFLFVFKSNKKNFQKKWEEDKASTSSTTPSSSQQIQGSTSIASSIPPFLTYTQVY